MADQNHIRGRWRQPRLPCSPCSGMVLGSGSSEERWTSVPPFLQGAVIGLVLYHPFVGNLANKAPSSHFPPIEVLGHSLSPPIPLPMSGWRLDLGCLGGILQRPSGLWNDINILQVTMGRGGYLSCYRLSGSQSGRSQRWYRIPHPKPAPGAQSPLSTGIYCGGWILCALW